MTAGSEKRTHRGESRMNGMRFERIQFSTLLHETDAARAMTLFVTSDSEASAAAPVADTVTPCASFSSRFRMNT
jgi:hypothetical protein